MSLWTFVIGVFLTAQTGEGAGQGQPPEQPAAEEQQVIDPYSFTYNPFGKRDPFENFLSRGQIDSKPQSANPLLNYDLSKFYLTGIVWGMANPRAIVKDGDNRGHIIRRGTRIGRNRGKVMRILKDRVVIAEEFRDPLGKLIVSEYSMKLNNEEEEKLKLRK